MSGYTDAVGGAPVGVAGGSYASIALAASLALVWPPYASNGQPFARLMDVSPSLPNLTLQLPDATLASAGEACLVNNKGSFAFSLLDGAGNVLAVIQPSEVRYAYLMDNSTAAGLWALVLFGKSNSSQDASQFVGPGLKAINNTLAWAPVTTLVAGTATMDQTYRGKVVVWTGGAGTLNMLDLAVAGNDFVFEFRNQGSGVASLTPPGGQLIDGSASASFNINESALIHANSTGWYTVGRGRSTQFAFSQLVKNVAGGGGTTTLSLTEASSVVQSYTGALSGTQTVVVPSVVQVYYASNQTSGGNSIIFKTGSVGGSSVTLNMGQSAVLFCDGTNVTNANTTTSGLTSLVLGAGAAGSPVISVGSAGNGFYAPGTNQLGLSVAGVNLVTWSAGAVSVSAPTVTQGVVATAGSATLYVDRISGQTGSVRFRTSGVDRFAFSVSNVAETGGNAGSDFFLDAFTDGGVIGNVLSVNRNTRTAFFSFLPVAAGATVLTTTASQSLFNKTIDGAQNTVRNIDLGSAVVGVLPTANGGTGGQGGMAALLTGNLINAFINGGPIQYRQLQSAGFQVNAASLSGGLFTYSGHDPLGGNNINGGIWQLLYPAIPSLGALWFRVG